MAGKPQSVKDRVGQRYGRLVINSLDRRERFLNKTNTFWNCICDCGNKKVVNQNYLTSMQVKSCGCWYKENRKLFDSGSFSKRHGMRSTHFYGIWKGINGRCYVPSNSAYRLYGACGITSSWRESFEQFKLDMYDSYLVHMSHYGKKSTTIDRIDSSKGYCKENCRWATPLVQRHNQKRWVYAHDPDKISNYQNKVV